MIAKPISRVSKASTKKQSVKFKWWMALVLVVIVAVIGIAVVRFSRASAIPPEEFAKIQAGIVIDSGITGADVKYAPYGYERHFNLAEAIKAQQDPVEYQKLMDLVIADLEAIYVKNHPSAPPPGPINNTTAPASTTAPSNTSTTTDSAQTAPQQATATTTTNTPSDSVQSQTSTPPKDLGTLSGYLTLDYTTQDSSSIKSIALLVDNTMVEVKRKPPYQFNFDSRQFKNGTHNIKVIITKNDSTTEQRYYTASFSNTSFFDKYIYPIGTPWQLVFKN